MHDSLFAMVKRTIARVLVLETDLDQVQLDLGDVQSGVASAATVLTATSGSVAVTALQANVHVFVTNTGAGAAVTYTLPAAVSGMRVTAIVKAAQELRLDPNGTETISLPSSGVQQAAGKYITADALGESVTLICTVAGTWDAVGSVDGTWGVEP